jgi:hypothetical protein
MIRYQSNPAAVIQAAPPRCQRSVTEKLAETIREMGHGGEVMTGEALRLRGFSERVCRRHGEAAHALARRRSVRRLEA